MRNIHYRDLLLIVHLLIFNCAYSQKSNWKNITSPYQANAFAESDQSYWIACIGGLVEVNKTSLKQKIYLPDNSGLKGCRINDVLVKDDNEVYVATQDRGIFIFDGNNWSSVQNLENTNKDQPTKALMFDHDKNVWFIATKNNTNNIFQIKHGNPQNAIGKYRIPGLVCMTIDVNNQLWAADYTHIYKLGENGIIDSISLSRFIVNEFEKVQQLFVDSDNNLYIHTAFIDVNNKQVDRLNLYSNDQFIEYWNSSKLELGFKFSGIYFQNDSFFILSNSRTLSQVDVLNNELKSKISREQIAIPGNQYLQLIIGADRNHKLCFQTFDTVHWKSEVFIDGFKTNESLVQSELPFSYFNADDIVLSSDNSIWIAIGGACYQYSNNVWTLRDNHFFNIPVTYGCKEIKTDASHKQMYFVFEEYPNGKTIIKIIGNEYVQSLTFPDLISDLSIGKDDQFLLISDRYLYIYNKDKLTTFHDFNGNIWEVVSNAIIDNENGIWITSYNIDNSNIRFYFYDKGILINRKYPNFFNFDELNFLYADLSGNLIGSSFGKIWKYSIQNNSYQSFVVPNIEYGISNVIEDANGFYWLSTENGFYRWDGGNEFVNWNMDDYPLLGQQVNKMIFDNYDNLWISQVYGITIFNENGLSNESNSTQYEIKGMAFFDVNRNGKRDEPNEPLLPNRTLNLLESNKKLFTQYGSFQYYIKNLNQTLSIDLVPTEVLTTKPAQYSITKDNYKSISFDFGIWSDYPNKKVSLDVYSNRARCLSDKQFTIQIYNNNPTKSSQLLEFRPDSRYSNLLTSSNYDRKTNQSIYWDNIEIEPFGYFAVKIFATTPSPHGNMDMLCSEVYLTDRNIFENQCYLNIKDTLFCSFDPNDKIQDFFGETRSSESLKSNTIKYTIRFQNTGNDTAYNIYILDTLDSNLDVSTLEFVNSSNHCNVELIDNKILKFFFPRIFLPFQKQSELGSQGYVSYKIRPKTNILHNTIIQNTAHIYFDLNDPIQTNMTSFISVDYFPKVASPKTYNSIIVKPNPSSHFINIEFEENAIFKIFNILGQSVLETQNTNINIENFEKGIYLIHSINSAGQKVTTHFEKLD